MAGEVLTGVDTIMEENRKHIPASKWNEIRRRLMHQMLMPLVQQKLIVVNAMQVIPEEALPEIEKQVDKQFYEEQVKEMMDRAKVNSLIALETKLKEGGSSIELQKRVFFERSLASQWMHQQVADNQSVTHLEMLEYYSSHLDDYKQPDRCRWQQLTARFDKFSSREAAWQAIAGMGNAVVDGGVPLETVARDKSQGLTAAAGGLRNWTTRGALVSSTLDEAIFTLPVGELSPILTDRTGFHIVRIIERVDAHCTPFRMHRWQSNRRSSSSGAKQSSLSILSCFVKRPTCGRSSMTIQSWRIDRCPPRSKPLPHGRGTDSAGESLPFYPALVRVSPGIADCRKRPSENVVSRHFLQKLKVKQVKKRRITRSCRAVN